MVKNEYQKLFNLVTKLNKEEGEICLICHFPIKENLLKLKCGHYFHRQCLLNEKNKKYSTIKCPYCEKTSKLESKSNDVCKAIIKSGINKGKICNRINCKYHN
tara:strand:+ start:424 stop:732 length:309 start_codon:yes stop_codon:yes gene_type:complete